MKKAKVWDLAVRLFHWGVGALVAVAFLTSEEDETIPIHIRVGLLVLGAVVFRVAWGIWGTPYARFRAFVRAPREVLAYAREYIRGRPPLHVSHNPLGAVMVIALLATLLGTTLTGIVAYAGPEWGGALASSLSKREAHAIKELHEALAGLLLVLVGIHVAGVVASSILERQNLVLGMITGQKRVEGPVAAQGSRLRSVVGLLGAAFVAYGAVRVVLFLLPVSTAEAATPAGPRVLLSAYEEEARKEEASFQRSDAGRGRRLYATEVTQGSKKSACTTCHTDDPRKGGRSPAGKLIEPLAPSANPERFTDRKKADKWFDRNCKQVLGRQCSAGEKADLLAYLFQL